MFGFCDAEANRLHDTLVIPRSESKGPEGEYVKLSDDDILTLNVDCGVLGEEMECEAEDQAEQHADRVRTISDPGQPSKREREEHEATHAEVGSLRVCEAHTFVMDYSFPSEGSQQGITVPVIKEMKTKADIMTACGCGRAILKNDGEPSIGKM